jgi:hypothetical protein
MAMSVGSPGGEGEVMMEINTTPLIDVMLVLLIMLIITIPVQTHAVKLDMPITNQPPPDVPPVVINLDIDFDGTISWNGTTVPDRATLESYLPGPGPGAAARAAYQAEPAREIRRRRRGAGGVPASRADEDRLRRQRAIHGQLASGFRVREPRPPSWFVRTT